MHDVFECPVVAQCVIINTPDNATRGAALHDRSTGASSTSSPTFVHSLISHAVDLWVHAGTKGVCTMNYVMGKMAV